MYFLEDQGPKAQIGARRNMNVVVRTSLPFDRVSQDIRRIVRGMDPTLPVVRLRTMDDVFAATVSQPRFLVQLLGIFAALALVLSAIGTYGILSYSVSERRREIGIRLALGADQNRILRDVLGQSLRLAVRGVVLGLALALVLAHLMSSLLYGVTARDPLTLLAAAATILIVSALAAAHPAWRATRCEPAKVLRTE